jgi:FkbM family methyltransferase
LIKPQLFEEFRIVIFEFNDLILPYILNLSDYNKKNIGEGTYEFKNVIVKSGDIVVDAGANFGIFTLFCLLKRGVKRVYAFEPSQTALYYLKENIKVNDLVNKVVICEYGLSFDSSKVRFEENAENFGGGKITSTIQNLHSFINTITLDSYLKERVDFIKADIEGFERYMLIGASKSISKYSPRISICTYHFHYDKHLLQDIVSFINSDYKIYHASGKMYCSI